MNVNLLNWKIQDLVAELSHLEAFTYVMENEVRNASSEELAIPLSNEFMACLVMQETKIKELITATDELSNKLIESKSDNIPIEVLTQVYRGELPESELDKYATDHSVLKDGFLFTLTQAPKTDEVRLKTQVDDSVYYNIKNLKTGESRVLAFSPDFFDKMFSH